MLNIKKLPLLSVAAPIDVLVSTTEAPISGFPFSSFMLPLRAPVSPAVAKSGNINDTSRRVRVTIKMCLMIYSDKTGVSRFTVKFV